MQVYRILMYLTQPTFLEMALIMHSYTTGEATLKTLFIFQYLVSLYGPVHHIPAKHSRDEHDSNPEVKKGTLDERTEC